MATRDVAGILAEQEDSRVGLLGRLAEAAQGHARGLVVADLLVHAAGHLSVAVARLDGVDTDTVFSPLGSKTLDHVGHSTLRGVVEHLGERVVQALLVVDVGAHGRRHDDRALLKASLDPVLRNSLRGVEHTKDVHVEHLVEVIRSELRSGLHNRDTSVRRKGGDLAKLGLSLLDSLLHLVGIADIALVRLNLDAELLSDLLSVLLRIGVRAVEDGNVRTGAGSSLADAETTVWLIPWNKGFENLHATVTTADNNSSSKLDFEDHGYVSGTTFPYCTPGYIDLQWPVSPTGRPRRSDPTKRITTAFHAGYDVIDQEPGLRSL